MTSAVPTLPDWAVRGAPVVEENHEHATRATIVRITPTGLVRLDNGATYRLASHGRSLHKTGEHGPWIGHRRPTRLLSAEAHLRGRAHAIVKTAVGQMAELDLRDQEPSAVLAQMQAVVDTARKRLAEVEQETTEAVRRAADSAVS